MMRPMRAVLLALCAASVVVAQTPQTSPAGPPSGPVHLVTYLEVAPSAQGRTAALLRRYRQATRQEAGNLRAEALQRTEPRHHFALVEAWRDQAAVDAHRMTAHTRELQDAIRRDGHAPPDERVLRNTLTAPIADAAAPKSARYVLTHADALPPASRGSDLVLPLGEASRREPGNVRFDVLVQPTRLNHFTLVEVWRDRRAFEVHAAAPHIKDFRERFLRVTGALYDERLYVGLR